MKKHFISVMATILMFALLLTACGDPAPKTSGENTTTAEATEAITLTTGEKEEKPELPSPEELGFKGQELSILVFKQDTRNYVQDNDDFYDEKDALMAGEAVYDAAMERQRTIEEKYEITIKTEVIVWF